MHVSICVFCLIDYNCIIILLSVTVFVCHDKGNGFFFFLYNKFTSICILEKTESFHTTLKTKWVARIINNCDKWSAVGNHLINSFTNDRL